MPIAQQLAALAEQQVRLERRVDILEIQVARIMSDAGSEKGTRARVNDRFEKKFDEERSAMDSKLEKASTATEGKFGELDRRLRHLETRMAWGAGAIVGAQAILTVALHIFWK